MEKYLWEILVPTFDNEGNHFGLSYHQKWDEKVRAVSGGLTVLKTSKGQWVSREGDLYYDRMIPVRIHCTKSEIKGIIEMSMEYYRQLAIICYRISDLVLLVHKEDLGTEEWKSR
jgi:hypothetical protein